MDRDFEKRFFISMFLMVLFFGFYIYIFQQMGKKTSHPVSSTETTTNTLVQTPPLNISLPTQTTPPTNLLLQTPTIRLVVSGEGAGISQLSVDGEWNQSDSPVSLFLPPQGGYGALQWEKESFATPVFSLVSSSPTSSEWTAQLAWNSLPLEVRIRYEILSNYTFLQTISISNRAKEAIKIDYQGRSFLLRWRPDIMNTNDPGSGNMQTYGAYIGKKFVPVLKKGFFSAGQNTAFVSNFQWLSLADNYFVFLVEPKTSGVSASYDIESRHKTYEKTAITLYLPVLLLGAGETTHFTIQYYCGPRKESLLRSLNPTYGQLFRWPMVFAWFMKPIEWVMVWLFHILGSWITNKGIVIILIALLVKLLLSPLSIQAAISVKKQQLLQPKIKNIQEKYKDNQQLLQQKIMELYKKEKINPLGGCFPLLLQIPVFFALYRVLSHSVELKGATFLWIKDLTQPDTLFTLNIPFLPNHFNLLPLIMTAIQLLQTKLQTAKNPAMKGQELNMYLLPLVFLFLFWNMPSGLVLYWTIQNIYTIIEQEIINLDRHIRV
ncbi:MAG: membrane protein insertase YidC [Brevinematales bacterium]|nr:membrane protein insertase YidC [Brevinematales bacterium]